MLTPVEEALPVPLPFTPLLYTPTFTLNPHRILVPYTSYPCPYLTLTPTPTAKIRKGLYRCVGNVISAQMLKVV